MNTFKKKLVTGAIVAAAVAVCCPAAFAMGAPGGGQMGGMPSGGQMGGGMQMQQSVGQTGAQQSGSFGQNSFSQPAQSVDTVSSATTQTQSTQTQQSQMQNQQSQTQQGQTQNQQSQTQQGQTQNQQGQTQQGQAQNGQRGQMPGMNGQGQQGGLLESIASAVGVETSTTASTDKTADPETLVTSIKTAVEALDSDDLAALAKKYNIDTTDMTDDEIVAAVEKLLEKPADNGQGQNGQQGPQNGQQGGLLESIATAVGVDTDSSTDADTLVTSIKTAVEALDSDDLAALAKKYNIDTTDMTDDEIVAAVEKLLEKPADNGQGQNGQQGPQNGQQGGLLESIATAVGVDTDSSTDADTLVTSIKAAVEALDSDDLAALAKKYNIDTTDMTDDEIVAAVEKLLEKPADNGQGQNGQQGKKGGMLESLASDAGVTVTANEKPETIVSAIKTAVEALDSDDLAALAEKYDIDTTDMTDDEIVAAVEALLTPPTGK